MEVSILRLASIIAEIINNGLAEPSFTQQDAEAYDEEEEDDEDPWEDGVYTYAEVPAAKEEEVKKVYVADPKGKRKGTPPSVEPKKKPMATDPSGVQGRTSSSPKHGRR
jgi:type IV secretory pathway VirB9-like protein